MDLDIYKVIYLVGALITGVIRAIYRKADRKGPQTNQQHHSLRDQILVFMAFLSMVPLPLLYIFTSFFDFANFTMPDWLAWTGGPALMATNLVFWRAHADLGPNWSAQLEIQDQHQLVTRGAYRLIRHPMYAGVILGGIGQACLLHNWIAGPAMLIVGFLFLIFRIPAEEKMLVEHFGEAYLNYQARTGRVFPRF